MGESQCQLHSLLEVVSCYGNVAEVVCSLDTCIVHAEKDIHPKGKVVGDTHPHRDSQKIVHKVVAVAPVNVWIALVICLGIQLEVGRE